MRRKTPVTDEEKRWVVIGLCLTRVLTPALRKALATEMPNWYNDLCQHPTKIDKQVYPTHQRELSPSTLKLNYKNINKNDTPGRKPPAYDYAVKDTLSLAKLFVQPYMCHFTGFDETMDSSAVLSLISEAEPFINMGAAVHAKKVKEEIRNAWAHCNFAEWTKAKFDACFQDMDTLLKSINLSPKKEEKLCEKLRSWKDKEFLQSEMNSLIDEVIKLSNHLKSNANEARLSRLISVQGEDTLRKYSDSLHPPDTLTTTLNDHRETLETLHETRVITPAQMKVLFPQVGISSSSNYDLSLLLILLHNICGINPPAATGSWDENPPENDTSLEADLARIEFYRNKVLNNNYAEVSEDNFNNDWDAISGALLRIHNNLCEPFPTTKIEELKRSPVGEDSYKIFRKLGKMEEQMIRYFELIVGKLGKMEGQFIRYFKLIVWFLISIVFLVFLWVYFSPMLGNWYKTTFQNISNPNETETISLQKIFNTDFVGREWIFRELENMTSSKESRGVLVLADPGWGKSTIMRQLINSSSSSAVIHKNIIGYYFCNFNDKRTLKGGRFVKKLSRLIAEKAKFREIVIKDDDCENLPVECFREAIIKPLEKLDETGRGNSYILIDALDECLEKENGHESMIKKILNKNIPDFPSWVKLIVTSRNQAQSIGGMSKILGFSTLEIPENDERNKQDLRSYAEQKLQNLSAQTGQARTDKELINLALESSKGNFLFLNEIIKYWKAYPHKINRTSIPESLGSLYTALFTERFKEDHLRLFEPLLEVLLAANVPPTLDEIAAILNLNDAQYDTRKVARDLSEYFKPDIAQAPLEFYHQFFAEWLTNETHGNNGIFIQKSRGHQCIVDFLFHSYMKKRTDLTFEKLFELCIHILNAGERASDENLKTLSSFNVSEVRNPRMGCILHDLASRRDASKIIAALIGQFNNFVDILDDNGVTPAMYAVEAGSKEILKIFIDNGANVSHMVSTIDDKVGCFLSIISGTKLPLRYFSMNSLAAYYGYMDIAELLVKSGADIDKTNSCGLTPLHFAVKMGHFEIVQLYLNHGIQADAISLLRAAIKNHTEIMNLLLNTGIRDTCPSSKIGDSEIWCYTGITHLRLCLSGTALYAAVSNNNTEMVKLILKSGNASVNCRHGFGRTPLMEAITQENVEMVQHLISAGADINAECKSSEDSYLVLLSHLIRTRGLHYFPAICNECRVIDFLFAHGLWEMVIPMLSKEQYDAISSSNNSRWSPETVAAINDQVNFISTTYGNRISTIPHVETVLRYVVVCHSVKTFKYLWNSGELTTKFRTVYDDGKTLLHFATSGVYETEYGETLSKPLAIHCPVPDEVPAYIVDEKRLEMVKLLTKILSSEINKQDNRGRTALHYAAVHGLPKIVKIFVNAEAYLSVKDERGDTALELALREKPNIREQYLPCRLTSDQVLRLCSSTLFDESTSYLIQKASIKSCNNKTKKLLDDLIQYELPLSLYELFRSGLDVQCAHEHFVRALKLYSSAKTREILKVFQIFQINLDVKCGIPFRQSELHLMAYVVNHWGAIAARPFFQRFIANNSKGFDILNECYDKEGYLLMHRAIQNNNYDVVSWLIENDVDVTRKTRSGLSPLVLSTRNYLYHSRSTNINSTRIFEELLEKHNESNFQCNSELIDLSPLHIAGSRGVKILKIIHGKIPQIPLDCTNKDGIHPVYLACLHHATEFELSPEDEQSLQNLECTAPLKYPKREAEYHLIYNKLFRRNRQPKDLRNVLSYKDLFRCSGINELLPHKTDIKNHIKVNECATRCQQFTFEASRDFLTSFPDLHFQKIISSNFTGSFIDISVQMARLRFFLVRTFYFNSNRSISVSALKNLWKKTINARSCAHHCSYFETMLLLQEEFTGRRWQRFNKVGEFVAERMGLDDTSLEGDVLYGWPFSFLLKKALKIDKEYRYLEILEHYWDHDR